MRRLFLIFVFQLLLLCCFSNQVYASGSDQFITLVNPVRISRYTKNPKESVLAQYGVTKAYDLPVTWLLTYDAFMDNGINSIILQMDKNQEIGIFLEVTPELAKAANIKYNNTGSWHHATSVFLSGYTQEERKIIIDTLFGTFKNKIGYYPTSVGSWWTDSYSLTYMKEKYSITANLGCADQFGTDGYMLWGQPWSVPYLPGKYHAGIPGQNKDTQLDLVTIQWASRDPLNGYENSLYSQQDYFVVSDKLNIEYFNKLVSLYAFKAQNDFGQITVGLEGDLNPDDYKGEYEKQISLVNDYVKTGQMEVLTMNNFSEWYRAKYQFTPSHFIESDDLLDKTDKKVMWYQSRFYRIGMTYDVKNETLEIFDFRSYHKDIIEPYYFSPNKEFTLSINIPAYFDKMNYHLDVWKITAGKLIETESEGGNTMMKFDSGISLKLSENKIEFTGPDISFPKSLALSTSLSTNNTDNILVVEPKINWLSSVDELTFKGLTPEASHLLSSKKVIGFYVFLLMIILIICLLVIKRINQNILKIVLALFALLSIVVASGLWYKRNLTTYYINYDEIAALRKLQELPHGRVVVRDQECLYCSWHTPFKPAVFANQRDYVRRISKKPIIYSSSLFLAEDQSKAKEEFDKLHAEYIYLTKYEGYRENIPFSPGDLGIEKVYENANAEIWKASK